MEFSVVIPVYNSAAYICRTLDSVVACAGDKEYEVILVDDCSADMRELEGIVSGYHCVRLVRKPKKTNAADSRNLGFEKAKSSVVFFLDADDSFLAGYVDRRMKMLLETGAALIFGDYISKAEGKTLVAGLPVYKDENMRDYLFVKGGDCRSSTLSVNKSLFQDCRFDNQLDKHQDWGFVLKVYDAGKKIVFDNEPGVLLHVYHSGRMSSSFKVEASKVFVRKYLSEKKHLNGFSRKHWKSTLVSKNTEAIRFFFGIYRQERFFSFDTVRYCFYRVSGFYPFVLLASTILAFFRRMKWR